MKCISCGNWLKITDQETLYRKPWHCECEIAAKDARIAELEEAMGIEIETQQTYKRLAIEKDAQISALNQKVEKLWAANKKARDKIFSLIIPYRKHINLESDTLKDIAADLAIDAITPSREKGEI